MLQDVASDDSARSGIESTTLGRAPNGDSRRDGAPWPRYSELLTLTTWCGGTGAAWAERRTELVSSTAHGGRGGRRCGCPSTPRGDRCASAAFLDVYGERSSGRKVPGRVTMSR